MNRFISKTAFLKFEQCSKSFFYYWKFYNLRDKPDVDTSIAFSRGHEIGSLAQQLFPGGINVVESNANKEHALLFTEQLMKEKVPVIYEATFAFEGVLIMVDILLLTENGYEAYEVKSSVRISEIYLKDACLQYYVLKNVLSELHDIFIVTINDQYIYKDLLDVKKLFRRRSVLKDAVKNYQYILNKIGEANLLIEMDQIPNISIGKQCFSPYKCDFYGTCWKGLDTEDSVFNLGKLSKEQLFEWYDQGKRKFPDLYNEEELSLPTRIQLDSYKENKAIVNVSIIKGVLSRLQEPYASLDMEIWSNAIPAINGTKPFQKLPFLFALYEPTNEHAAFFNYDQDDRRAFVEVLIERTRKYSTILLFDKNLESAMISELIHICPELRKELENVRSKFLDVADVIQQSGYYNYLMRGNYTLKSVASVLLSENPFNEGTIQSGLEAMTLFNNYRYESSDMEKVFLKERLITYCMADAKATYRITEELKRMIKAEAD